MCCWASVMIPEVILNALECVLEHPRKMRLQWKILAIMWRSVSLTQRRVSDPSAEVVNPLHNMSKTGIVAVEVSFENSS